MNGNFYFYNIFCEGYRNDYFAGLLILLSLCLWPFTFVGSNECSQIGNMATASIILLSGIPLALSGDYISCAAGGVHDTVNT